ncbi:hypothetical protein PT273_06590 [Orbaceae bacterium ESL0727]|nr:hypothetical protein [Orbaceae bacterium ESL0727]
MMIKPQNGFLAASWAVIRCLVISLLLLNLVACQLFPSSQPAKPVVKVPNEVKPLPDDRLVSPPSLKKTTDWQAILSPFVAQLVQSPLPDDGNKVLLISDIQNRSGNYVASNQIDTNLHALFAKQNRFTILDKMVINQAKQALGISQDDKLVSRSKMIALAKSLQADYVLFITINKAPVDDNTADLSMELIYTKSGEIIQRITSAQIASQANEASSDTGSGVGE